MPIEKLNPHNHVVSDQMGQEINVAVSPRRIISLVPSQTELLFDLGLSDAIVGVTRFCVHPEEKVAQKEKIGGTKKFDIEKIRSLSPDLIIGNKEENYEVGITELKKHFPIWMSEIYTLDDAYDMMRAIGALTNKPKEADQIIKEIQYGFKKLSPATTHPPPLSCAYFIWRKPYMVAAAGTFIDHMLGVFGVRNAFGDLSRYPEVKAEEIAARKPELIFLSSEPYSFGERHISEFKHICPDAKVVIADGELFSWYGSRLRHTAAYFERLRQMLGAS